MIKSAETIEDLRSLRPLFWRFHELARLPGEYDVTVEDRLLDLVKSGTGFVFFAESHGTPVGTLGGVIIEDLFTRAKYAQELFWYVDPSTKRSEVGSRLLAVYETLAKTSAAKIIRLTALAHLRAESVGAVYERRGYALRELHYERSL